MMIVKDATTDERFSHNQLVTGDPQIRFYAGASLLTPEKLHLGTLCLIDNKPRELSPQQLAALNALARQVSLRLELRRTTEQLRRAMRACGINEADAKMYDNKRQRKAGSV